MRIDEMNEPTNGRQWPRVGEVVEAYEAALAQCGQAEMVDFVPSADHPNRWEILCELIRVDLEHRWERGQCARLEEYQGRFPDVFEDSELARSSKGVSGRSLEPSTSYVNSRSPLLATS
jgi:hypothetical protein